MSDELEMPETPCAWCQGTGKVVIGMDEDGLVYDDCQEC